MTKRELIEFFDNVPDDSAFQNYYGSSPVMGVLQYGRGEDGVYYVTFDNDEDKYYQLYKTQEESVV